MKKIILICTGMLAVLAVAFFLFANTQYGRVVIGVYQINAGLGAPRKEPPPIGLWHAVYTKEFAEQHDLPPENITDNLSDGIDYMEMETLPRTIRGPYTMCMVNMLVKKPHDIAMYGNKDFDNPHVSNDRKLLHLIDIQDYSKNLKIVRTLSPSFGDAQYRKFGFGGGAKGLYVENVLSNFDYFSTNYDCRSVLVNHKAYPSDFGFRVDKSSVWGKYDPKYTYLDQSGRPKGEDYFNSKFFISIPEELILNIFKKQ